LFPLFPLAFCGGNIRRGAIQYGTAPTAAVLSLTYGNSGNNGNKRNKGSGLFPLFPVFPVSKGDPHGHGWPVGR